MTQIEFARQFSHADVLLSQGRYKQAEDILDRLVATGFEDNDLFRMLAVAKMGLKKYDQAEELCRMVISRNPNEAFAFYILANLRSHDRNFGEALGNLSEAIRIDPSNTNFHAFHANILLHTKDFEKALSAADRSLSLDAENTDGLNARASALIGLNRGDEAFETISKSLASDPNNSDTHANMGWGLLHQGMSDKALVHFRSALKEEPMNEFARSGMMEAMKAKFPVYRYFLVVMLWLGKLKGANQWGVIIGSYILFRILFTLAESVSWLQPFLYPIIGLMVLFFISTWIFSPLMNLYLLSNNYGRLMLNDQQKSSARWVGISLLASVFGFLIYFFIYQNDGILSASFFLFVLMIPLGSMNNPQLNKNRTRLNWAAISIAVIVIVDSVIAIAHNTFMSSYYLFPLITLVAYQWYANYLLIRE
ncbi:MAG: hypothetical protein IPL55_00790 [Saprospiraceae bacterium]|jgi:tetratricopeptide (TPR) repeat protein|nr:hypothetical protein [Saprospiraceae bacterium]